MELRPQDLVVALKFVADSPRVWTYASLGAELAMSPSQVFRSVARAEAARLLGAPPYPSASTAPSASNRKVAIPLHPQRASLKEFLIHGVQYAFPAEHGGMVRGMPTAHAAAPLRQHFGEAFEPPPVWPDPQGPVRGTEFSPLYKNVPAAARRDQKLYELLALVDAIRDGRMRERELAIKNSPADWTPCDGSHAESEPGSPFAGGTKTGAASRADRIRRRLRDRSAHHRSGSRSGAPYAGRGCYRRSCILCGVHRLGGASADAGFQSVVVGRRAGLPLGAGRPDPRPHANRAFHSRLQQPLVSSGAGECADAAGRRPGSTQ